MIEDIDRLLNPEPRPQTEPEPKKKYNGQHRPTAGRPRIDKRRKKRTPAEIEEARLRELARAARKGKPGAAPIQRAELETQYRPDGKFDKINKKIFKPLEIKAHMDRREIFKILISEGKTFRKAMTLARICPVEAASCLDEMIKDNRDGVTAYLIAEEHLIASMQTLNELMSDDDSKVRLMAAAKLSDTSYKILTNRNIIERSRKVAEKAIEKVRAQSNTWDAEFEGKT